MLIPSDQDAYATLLAIPYRHGLNRNRREEVGNVANRLGLRAFEEVQGGTLAYFRALKPTRE